jgi:serine protease AprX
VIGRGVGVAILDSGIYAHPDLAGRVVAAIDFTSATPIVSPVALGDPGGHGTHVAGLVAGDGTSSGGAYTGVAPGANLIDVRVIDANGRSSVSLVLAGLNWVLKNRATYNIKVVNLSLGSQEMTSYTLSPLSTAVEVLSFAGVTVVVSAGNSGSGAGTITTPGDDPFVITVGAVDDAGTPTPDDDSMASWSSCGPTTFDALAKPDLVAPGRHMVSLRSPGSALDTLYPWREVTAPGAATADYFALSGTSMAAPVVAGAVALLLEKDPTLNPRQVKQRLISGVTPLSFGTTMTRGAGMLNALTSVGSTDRTAWNDAVRVSDGFASLVFPLIAGQPLVWRDLLFNGGFDSMGIPWGAITWTDITWDTVTWTDITWDSITWESITWESVAAQDITWDTAFDPLSGSGPGWVPVN